MDPESAKWMLRSIFNAVYKLIDSVESDSSRTLFLAFMPVETINLYREMYYAPNERPLLAHLHEISPND